MLFTVKLVNGLRGAGAGNGTLLGAYNGVLLGIAEASMDEWDRAARTLKSSLQFNGGMDHPLTPVALVELANIGVQTENYSVAGTLALEASYSAAVFNQYDLVEEALALGTQIHLMTEQESLSTVGAGDCLGESRESPFHASFVVGEIIRLFGRIRADRLGRQSFAPGERRGHRSQRFAADGSARPA